MAEGDLGGAGTSIPLSRKDLVVELSHLHAQAAPRVEMRAGVDGSANTVLLTDGPILVESSSALNGWGVDALSTVDVVCAAVGVDGSDVLGPSGGIIGTKVVADVVFDERVSGPSVQRKVRVPSGIEAAAVRNDSVADAVSQSPVNIDELLTGHCQGSSRFRRRHLGTASSR